MIHLTLLAIVAVAAAGSVAGALGSLLGIGGGVFLVPFLNAGLGLPFKVAAATGLMTVIATSSAVSAGRAGQNLINLRLGMLLEVATTIGGLIAAFTVAFLSDNTLNLIFAVVTAAITALMLTRLDRRNVLEATASPGSFGGRFHDHDTGREVVYRVKRLPLGMA
ncbi:MAG TPA: sulfite exporter TauE/SafE family protein, partial [Vicinamibacterales bacterium]|nr:sulfite exporter TauE/SafE family protein [Vicinamibacterales bacterium]